MFLTLQVFSILPCRFAGAAGKSDRRVKRESTATSKTSMSLRSELMEHGLFCIPTEKESIQMPPINVIYLFSLWSGQKKKKQANLPEPSCHCQITQSRWGKRLANKWKRNLIFISFCTGGEVWLLYQSLIERLPNWFSAFNWLVLVYRGRNLRTLRTGAGILPLLWSLLYLWLTFFS